MTLFKCEILQKYGPNKGEWVEVEVFGDHFEKALRDRFGTKAEYRNPMKRVGNRWEKVKP